jgi:hypothetical protein
VNINATCNVTKVLANKLIRLIPVEKYVANKELIANISALNYVTQASNAKVSHAKPKF